MTTGEVPSMTCKAWGFRLLHHVVKTRIASSSIYTHEGSALTAMTELVVPRSMPTAMPLAAAGNAIHNVVFRAEHFLFDLSRKFIEFMLRLISRVASPWRVYMKRLPATPPAVLQIAIGLADFARQFNHTISRLPLMHPYTSEF